jgi:SPP1 gp7 family putative phage head morphogenesis protein
MPAKNKNRVFNYTLTQRIEQDYGRDLYNVSREVDRIVTDFTNKLDKSADKIEVEDVGDLIEKLQEYSEKINDWANKSASRMIGSLQKQELKQWEQHSEKMSTLMKQELTKFDVNKAMKQYLADNVHLITSLPLTAAQRVHDIVYNNLTTGKRASTVAAEIMNTGKVTQARANLIARTETGRAVTGLIKVRSESVGIDWFVWRTTHDRRLRTAHKLMDGVLVKWSDPPSPEKLFAGRAKDVGKPYGNYLPNATFNCRCYPAPLIRLDDVSWPARVHRNGKITTMNKEQFQGLTKDEYRLAA